MNEYNNNRQTSGNFHRISWSSARTGTSNSSCVSSSSNMMESSNSKSPTSSMTSKSMESRENLRLHPPSLDPVESRRDEFSLPVESRRFDRLQLGCRSRRVTWVTTGKLDRRPGCPFWLMCWPLKGNDPRRTADDSLAIRATESRRLPCAPEYEWRRLAWCLPSENEQLSECCSIFGWWTFCKCCTRSSSRKSWNMSSNRRSTELSMSSGSRCCQQPKKWKQIPNGTRQASKLAQWQLTCCLDESHIFKRGPTTALALCGLFASGETT